MTVSIVFPQPLIDDILEAAHNRLETAGVLLCSVAQTANGRYRLLARHMRWVDEEAYIRRERDSMAIASDGYVPALAQAEAIGATCLWVHTHPRNQAASLPRLYR